MVVILKTSKQFSFSSTEYGTTSVGDNKGIHVKVLSTKSFEDTDKYCSRYKHFIQFKSNFVWKVPPFTYLLLTPMVQLLLHIIFQ